jgi:acyl-CoA thioester hydrolase
MDNFYITKKIYYHDTDCGGVVYYANYLKYFEEARTEYFNNKGINYKALVKRDILFVVKSVEINFKAPARYQDELRILTRLEGIRSAALLFYQEAKKGDRTLAEAKTTLVHVGKDFKPRSIPDDIKNKF